VVAVAVMMRVVEAEVHVPLDYLESTNWRKRDDLAGSNTIHPHGPRRTKNTKIYWSSL
jgi:hypothetical protein